MDYMNCPEKDIIKERIKKIEEVNNMRDEEQERAINNLTTKMNNFMNDTKKEITEIKKDIQSLKDDLPNILKKELSNQLDDIMLKSFKKLFKWIFTITVSSIAFVYREHIINFIKKWF